MSNPYDIEEAFAAIEEELIESMIRNMKRHKAEEDDEGIQWEMWQAKQLEALERYKKANKKKFFGRFSDINSEIEELIREANKNGCMDQEIAILEATKKGFKGYKKSSSTMQAEFFKLNERKLDALINATTNDMQKAETAILRMADDQYRKVIYNAQVYANTGAGTYEQAVDMATKDMLRSGLNCVEYANGARHTLRDYADMAIRTASKRAYLQGEGTKRQEWGIYTVIMNKRGNPCPKCLPFCGKVLIDDVWSGGPKDGISPETGKKYPLMSKAIEAGLYHPRCKDSHTTYFEGLDDDVDDSYTKKELKEIEKQYAKEQIKQYAKRQAEKFERLEKNSLDIKNKEEYKVKANKWSSIQKEYEIDSAGEWLKTKAEEAFSGILQQKKNFRVGLENISDEKIKSLLKDSMKRTRFKRTKKKARYSPLKKTIYLKKSTRSDAIAHELFHEIDDYFELTAKGFLSGSLKADYRRLQNYANNRNLTIPEALLYKYPEAFYINSDEEIVVKIEYRAISDIIHGCSQGKVYLGYGHNKPGYWDDERNVCAEAFAQYGRIMYNENNEVEQMFRELFPTTEAEILEKIEGLKK